MDKKGVNEIRRLFDKNDCRVERMYGVYVNEKKERIADLKDSFHALQDEELFKYCEIFKKGLSGKIGKTLFNLDFPLEEEKEGGKQPEMYRLLRSGLKDGELVDAFFDRVIEHYQSSEKYLILLVHGNYDIPGRGRDGLDLEDASTEVYPFLQMSICPVRLLRDGLCYDPDEKAFYSRTEDWGVQKPDVSLLYPAFNERATDIHAALWYARNEEVRHEELSKELLGTELPRPKTAEQDAFREVLEITLGEKCDYDNVVSVNESLNELLREQGDSPEPVMLEKHDIRKILYDTGADDEAIGRFDTAYDELIGDNAPPILAENVTEQKKLSVKTDNLKLEILQEAGELIETRVIDGIEYFLIPVTDNVTVNGVRIRRKEE